MSQQTAIRVARYRPLQKLVYPLEMLYNRLSRAFATSGQVAFFVFYTLRWLPFTLKTYGRETFRILNNLAWGRGSLIVDGGVVSTMLLLGFGIGAMVSVEAFAALDMLGFGALTGVVGGLANVREMCPITAGIAFAAQAGCRMTAEVGAMRVAEEIDAIEALGIRSIPYVVGTRLLGGVLCVAPAYFATLLLSFVVSRTLVTVVHSQSAGTYNHYFMQFLEPTGILFSTVKAVAFCAAVTLIHCYYGYFTTGGPAGVGIASGRAIRTSLVTIIALDLLLSAAIWGWFPSYVFRG